MATELTDEGIYRARTLSEAAIDAVVAMLNQRVIDLVDLSVQTMHAHWNVRGSNFLALHRMFEEMAADTGPGSPWCDAMAERIGQLGRSVAATVRIAASQSSIEEYPTSITAGSDHVREIARRQAAFAHSVGTNARTAAELGDHVTAALLTDISVEAEKWVWLLEAHLQGE